MKTKRKLIEFAGVIMIIGSLALAILMHSKHFYALLVTGLLLIFLVVDRKLIKPHTYLGLYKSFFVAGLLGDFVLGLTVTKLWFYSYDSILGYLILYFLIYPVAGIVMLQTYLWLASKWLPKGGRREVHYKFYKRLNRFCEVVIICLGIGAIVMRGNHLILPCFFGAVIMWVINRIALFTHMHHHQNLLDKFINHPINVALIIMFATYLNAFLHELPNTSAHEWVYTNLPFMNLEIAGVPLAVFVGWPLLALYPVSAYYRSLAIEPKRTGRRLKHVNKLAHGR